jgi:hypothetical protein
LAVDWQTGEEGLRMMKLEVREITSAMVGSSESVIDFKAASQEEVTSLAQRIALREVLKEMHLSDDSGASIGRGSGAVINATSTVVAIAGAQSPLRMKGPIRRAG